MKKIMFAVLLGLAQGVLSPVSGLQAETIMVCNCLSNSIPTNKTVQCGIAWDFDLPEASDICSNKGVSISVTSTITNGTCPTLITRTWTLVDACGDSTDVSQTVTVDDNHPPVAMCSGINLVPNPYFENYGLCPDSTSETDHASPWYSPTDGSSDYFNACASAASGVSVPNNFAGAQSPQSGVGYGGGYVYFPSGQDNKGSYREYLQTPLLAPLVAGHSYTVSFYVNRSDNYSYAVADIGAYLSVGPVTNYGGQTILPVVPQVSNPVTNMLASTSAWMLIQDVYTATGGEDYLTLGNFKPDNATTAFLGTGSYPGSYYYYDTVSVIDVCMQATNKTIPCGVPVTFDNPVGVDLCSGSNVNVTIVSTVTNSACPQSLTRTWLLTDPCGNSGLWSQTVSVTNGSPFSLDCTCLQDGALTLLSTNGCSGIVPDLSVLSNSPCMAGGCGAIYITQSPAAGTVVGPGNHPITLFISSCSGVTNSCVLPYYVFSAPAVISCPSNIYALTCSNSAVVNYAVTATGNAGPVFCSPPSGSAFPLGTNTVLCTASNSCGSITTNFFQIIVRPPGLRFACLTKSIAIITVPMGTARMINIPDFPGGGAGVEFDNLDNSGNSGAHLDFGPAEKFTFSTVLDFNAAPGADMVVAIPSGGAATNRTPIINLRRLPAPSSGWEVTVDKGYIPDPVATFRSIAIGTNGELLSSFSHTGTELDTNVLLNLVPVNGAKSAAMTLTFDCRTREVTLAFPNCFLTQNGGRKGWDGTISCPCAQDADRVHAANLILTPITKAPLTPVTMLDLLVSNLTQIAFDDPSISTMGRVCGDRHVTIIKAYDDGAISGLEAFSFDEGDGINVALGHAASFNFRISNFERGDLPTEEQIFTVHGWHPGTTTNRPPPPDFSLRFAQNTNGAAGTDCSADFTQWGVSNVTVQLLNGPIVIAETNHAPASLTATLITLGDSPSIIGCYANGIVSLGGTNGVVVKHGLNCSNGCAGTELRIVAEFTGDSVPPVAFTGFNCSMSEGTDNLIYGLQSAPACSPVPLNVTTSAIGSIILDWQGDGFRLQGAESPYGPWHDLGVNSPPLTLPAGTDPRFFRLICD